MSELKSGRNGVKLFSKHDRTTAFINQQPGLPTQDQTRNGPAGLRGGGGGGESKEDHILS